jgi:PIN domain nuclease of toxin-antitoxin system
VAASVLDSWVMIGWLQGEEPARAKVRELLEQASRGETRVGISLINADEEFIWVGKRQAH